MRPAQIGRETEILPEFPAYTLLLASMRPAQIGRETWKPLQVPLRMRKMLQ